MNPVTVRALVEAGRRSQLIDPVAATRLVERLSAVPGDDLLQALDICDAVPADLRHRLGRLLAPSGRHVGDWTLLARLPAVTGQSWLVSDPFGEMASLRLMSGQHLGGDLAEAEIARRRFQREADACRRLDHPNLVRVLDGGTTREGEAWFVLEYSDGGDLAMALRLAGGHFDEAATVSLGVQIASGIAELARLGLVHRGVSPASILITSNGVAKLGEYGLLRSGDNTVTRIQPGGTDAVAWVAPELSAGGFATPAADVYALGCLLFACLAGRPPFVGNSLEVMRGHAQVPPPDLRQLMPQISEATAAAIAGALGKDPARRPPADALRSALASAREQVRNRGRTGNERSSSRLLAVTPGGTMRQGALTSACARRAMALSGNLSDMPLGDLLQTIQRMQSEGILKLTHGERVFAVAFANGCPVGFRPADGVDAEELIERIADAGGEVARHVHSLAHLVADGQPIDPFLFRLGQDPLLPPSVVHRAMEEQLFDQLCRRCAGSDESFEFTAIEEGDASADAALLKQALLVRVPHLLMEAARQSDETGKLARRLLPPWDVPVVPEADRAALAREYRLYPERTVLNRLDGSCAIADLPRRALATPYAVLRFCAELQERGLLLRLDAEGCRAAALKIGQRDAPAAQTFARAALAQRWDDAVAAGIVARAVAEAGEITSITLASAVARVGTCAGDAATALDAPWLSLVANADGSGIAVHLFSGPEFVLGKLARLPVHLTLRKYPEQKFLADSNQISRTHCRIAWLPDGSGWTVTDLGSANGTVLDGKRLPPEQAQALSAGEPAILECAGVLRFRLEPVSSFRPELPPLPAELASQPVTCPAALVLARQGNRPELCAAMVRGRICLGGRGADIELPGVPAGPHLVLCLLAGRWWWCPAAGGDPWRPVAADARLVVGPLTLTAMPGDYRLLH